VEFSLKWTPSTGASVSTLDNPPLRAAIFEKGRGQSHPLGLKTSAMGSRYTFRAGKSLLASKREKWWGKHRQLPPPLVTVTCFLHLRGGQNVFQSRRAVVAREGANPCDLRGGAFSHNLLVAARGWHPPTQRALQLLRHGDRQTVLQRVGSHLIGTNK
jgi:hypothetical protein